MKVPVFQRAIITHGGTGSNLQNPDAQSAAKIGMEILVKERSALQAVCPGREILRKCPQFNAGSITPFTPYCLSG